MPDGAVRELVPDSLIWDVSSPAVSPDGHSIAFAGTPHPDSAWRLFQYVERTKTPSTASPLAVPPVRGERYDDLEACWLDDSTLVFASTRGGERSQYDGSAVAQLWRFDLRTHAIARLTAERNGVEGPTVDPRTGRILYSRWWFNRWRPATAAGASPASSLTLDASRSLVRDTINQWQPMSIAPDGSDPRVAVAPGRTRRDGSLVQIAFARSGAILGVTGDALGMSPSPGALEVTVRNGRDAAPRHLAGAVVDPDGAPAYGSARGLASPSACAPAPLEDGRALVSIDRGGRGDFGVWIVDLPGGAARRLADLPGTLELDAVPWIPTPRRPVSSARPSLAPPPRTLAELASWPERFRFLDRDVFGGGFGADSARSARARGATRIRFWTVLPRAEAPGGDTLVLVREAAVARNGHVDERDLPAGIPMFEQLVDARGAVLMSAHGAAQVAGYNVGLPGRTTSCVGCHRGHSLKR
jgi:hypothetical protein